MSPAFRPEGLRLYRLSMRRPISGDQAKYGVQGAARARWRSSPRTLTWVLDDPTSSNRPLPNGRPYSAAGPSHPDDRHSRVPGGAAMQAVPTSAKPIRR